VPHGSGSFVGGVKYKGAGRGGAALCVIALGGVNKGDRKSNPLDKG